MNNRGMERKALVLAANAGDAQALADSLGIRARACGISQLRYGVCRGIEASCVLVDADIWPLTDDQLAEVVPCMAGQERPAVYRITIERDTRLA